MNHLLSIIGLFGLLTRPATQAELPARVTPTAQQAPKTPTTWVYRQTVETAGRVVYKAVVHSPTVLDLGYPYGNGAVATLTLRSKDGSTSAYIEFSKGSINRSFQNGTARVRFDGQPARRYVLTAAANGRANIIFLEPDRAFIESIRRARRLTIELLFAGQSNRQIIFPTGGLRWPHSW